MDYKHDVNNWYKMIDNEYVKNYYNFLGRNNQYDSYRWKNNKKDFDSTLDFVNEFNLLEGKYNLEIGCADGIFTSYIKNCVAIDISKEMIKQATKNLPDKTFIIGDFVTYNFIKRFDNIIAIRSFQYIKNKPRAIRKLYNIMNPAGEIYLIVQNPFYWRILMFRLIGSIKKFTNKYKYDTEIKPILDVKSNWKSMKYLYKILNKYFELISIRPATRGKSMFTCESYCITASRVYF